MRAPKKIHLALQLHRNGAPIKRHGVWSSNTACCVTPSRTRAFRITEKYSEVTCEKCAETIARGHNPYPQENASV